MSQESIKIRPDIVNYFQELPEFQLSVPVERAEVVTLYPYLDDTEKIVASMKRVFLNLVDRELWRKEQFIEELRNIGYLSEEDLTGIVDNTEMSPNSVGNKLEVIYIFSDGSSLNKAAIYDESHIVDDGDVILRDDDEWGTDDKAEQEFRDFVYDFNKRSFGQTNEIITVLDSMTGAPDYASANKPIEFALTTELKIIPSAEVLCEMRKLIESKRLRFCTFRSTLSDFSRVLGLQK